MKAVINSVNLLSQTGRPGIAAATAFLTKTAKKDPLTDRPKNQTGFIKNKGKATKGKRGVGSGILIKSGQVDGA